MVAGGRSLGVRGCGCCGRTLSKDVGEGKGVSMRVAAVCMWAIIIVVGCVRIGLGERWWEGEGREVSELL